MKLRREACSIEDGARACHVASRLSRITLWASAAIWLKGFSVAFLLPLTIGI